VQVESGLPETETKLVMPQGQNQGQSGLQRLPLRLTHPHRHWELKTDTGAEKEMPELQGH